jgi:hypothetical protein
VTSPTGAPIPDQKATHDPTSLAPHPRHRARSLLYARPTSRANHPTYSDFQLHLVHDDTAPQHDYANTLDDDRSRTRGANVSPTAGPARGDAVSTTDRGSDPRVLGSVRSGHGAVGDPDRLARIELPTGRREPHWLLLDLPDGLAPTRRVLRGGWLSRLVCRTLRRQGLDSGRSVAVCGLGLLTLAALIWQVL